MILTRSKMLIDEKMPFYSWQCLTLQLKHREVDLVIPDDQDMNDLLEILIDSMDTVNGIKDSAKIIKEKMH